MWWYKLILVFVAFKSSSADDTNGGLLNPCEISDITCLSGTTQNFLEKTSTGIADYNIKPIDPLVISELVYEVPEFDLLFHFKNLNVTGLKDQKISDFKLDKSTKSVILQTRVDNANIVSDVTIELKKPESKFFSGTYYAKTTVIGTSKYNYELIPNKDGVEYFEVGPETITCEALDVEVTLDPELAKQIGNDPDTTVRREEYYKKSTEIRKAIMSKIFGQAYVTVIHNIRASAKIFPKTAFFKDI